jgi:hypothetical protein
MITCGAEIVTGRAEFLNFGCGGDEMGENVVILDEK